MGWDKQLTSYPFMLPTKRCITLFGLLALGLSGCAHLPYIAKPVEPQQVIQKILEKDPFSAEFKAFCIAQGYPQDKLPFSSWGIAELTLSAQYHHPSLDVARTQLGVAKAAIESAGIKTYPTLGGQVARSNRANGDIRPFAYGLNVEIPIETANKRALRVEEAQHLAEAARLDVAEVAWGLRNRLKHDWLNYHEQQAQTVFLQHTSLLYDKQVELISKRVNLGLASNTDLALLLTQRAKVQAQLAQISSKKDALIATMAADAGLSKEKFEQIPVAALSLDEAILEAHNHFVNPTRATEIQSEALLNRIDIRRSLARYAAAESKIRLEVAKQIPDISLTPGFMFEFGDKVWSLGFTSLLSMLQKNSAPIHEAEQLRAVEGAQFEALQAQVIAEVSLAKAQMDASMQQLQHANLQKKQQLAALQKLQLQLDAGLIDRLQLTQAQMLHNNYTEELLNAQFGLLHTAARFENVMQRTMDAKNPMDTGTP